MKRLVLIFVTLVTLVPPVFSHAADVLNIGGFDGLGAASDVAEAKGFLAAEDISVVFHGVHDSVDLMTTFVSGTTDLIQTNADNVIAWAEGQGMDQQTHDFVIIMGGYSGLEPREITVAPEIHNFEDLRGKVLAVDAINTGYAPVLVYMLKENGLIWDRDYTLKSVGGGSMRRESMLKGETVGGLVGVDGELRQKGFHVLARSTDYFVDYARGVTTARRDWARRNGDLLVRYIRAMIRSINWLLDPGNRTEAIAIIMAADGLSADQAQRFYEESVHPDFGFIPNARLERTGVEQIIKVREVMGQMKPPLPSADKYIEERFYREAMDSM
jgi:ABC-type nitrate/sulfonate/bicarbonate transport system substrate-binding protein